MALHGQCLSRVVELKRKRDSIWLNIVLVSTLEYDFKPLLEIAI